MRSLRTKLSTGVLVAAVLLLGYATVTQAPQRAWSGAQGMMAAAGATLNASVPANPYNTLALQLQEEQQQLNAQEAAQPSQAPAQTANAGIDWGLYSFWASAALFALVALNFYYDVRRSRKTAAGKSYSVDLR